MFLSNKLFLTLSNDKSIGGIQTNELVQIFDLQSSSELDYPTYYVKKKLKKVASRSPFISTEEFKKLQEKSGSETVIQSLSECGILFDFTSQTSNPDLIVIDPQWFANMITSFTADNHLGTTFSQDAFRSRYSKQVNGEEKLTKLVKMLEDLNLMYKQQIYVHVSLLPFNSKMNEEVKDYSYVRTFHLPVVPIATISRLTVHLLKGVLSRELPSHWWKQGLKVLSKRFALLVKEEGNKVYLATYGSIGIDQLRIASESIMDYFKKWYPMIADSIRYEDNFSSQLLVSFDSQNSLTEQGSCSMEET